MIQFSRIVSHLWNEIAGLMTPAFSCLQQPLKEMELLLNQGLNLFVHIEGDVVMSTGVLTA